MYSLEYSVQAARFLKKCDKDLCERITHKIQNLKETPVPSDAKFMGRHHGDKVFRIRIGDYRALYKIKENEKIVLIAKIDKRPRAY